jgi:hypothetical protein
MIYFGSVSGSGSYFSVGFGPYRDPTENFSNILNINFILEFPSYKYVKLLIMTRLKVLRKFFYKKEFVFYN